MAEHRRSRMITTGIVLIGAVAGWQLWMRSDGDRDAVSDERNAAPPTHAAGELGDARPGAAMAAVGWDGGQPSRGGAEAHEPDMNDAPSRPDETVVDRQATRRGLELVQRNIQNLTQQAVAADAAGNAQRAALMRKRIVHLRERRSELERHLERTAQPRPAPEP